LLLLAEIRAVEAYREARAKEKFSSPFLSSPFFLSSSCLSRLPCQRQQQQQQWEKKK
jgi:hypothetical protein